MHGIEIYKTKDGQTAIEVKFEQDTVWLSQYQLVELFETDRTSILKHLQNIYTTQELSEDSTCAKFAQVRQEGKRRVKREVLHYNLDAILSVGYRVNSKRGTLFRQWATQRLNDYLVKGQAINHKRLQELGKMVELIEQQGKTENLQVTEAKGLLNILSHYTRSFVLLNQFDSHSLSTNSLNEAITYEIQYAEAKAAIAELKKQLMEKKEATDLFGNEKDDGFQSSLQSIVQTFDGQYLYPSVEEQAANLLYFVIKNHSFSDGNKRIGAFLFVWFLEKNKYHLKKSGELKINDNGLTALALLVAQSNPEEKEWVVKLIMNLINSPEQ
ncbi:RhuM family protein [Haliscomenobacter sp.]|uniref:RhuM family protein n=1 Tax=Haliscomenobacter sp. TaxID=2717303 RepID=UPI00359339CE